MPDKYPWGRGWPPRTGTANYASGGGGQPNLPGLSPLQAYGGNYYDRGVTTCAVMSFKPNKYLLYDMGGNVAEWVSDWFNNQQTERVIRGGSWFDSTSSILLSSTRTKFDPATHHNAVGFRCVVEEPTD